MSEAETKPAPPSGGKIKQTISAPWWVRVMRLVIAAVAAFLLYHAYLRFHEGRLPPTDAWLAGMIGTLGLTALVEAIFPNGRHGLLQFWGMTTLAATALVAWALGGANWIGILGLVSLLASFALAVAEAAKGR